MYQKIHEQISVVGLYSRGKFTPVKLKWRDTVLKITEITIQVPTNDGGVRKYFYSVVVDYDVFRLEFNRETQQWLLLEKWVE